MLYTKIKHRAKVIKELHELGVLPDTLLRHLEIFEYYESLDKELCVYCRYELTADRFGKSSDHIKTIIRKLKN